MNGDNSAKGIKAGEWVEVRSIEEILATLDDKGCLDNLPFMPEMVQYCGQRARISQRADKTCDPAHQPWSIRRLKNCVHLEGLRCNGERHGGCQAGCLLFWNEVWIKAVVPNVFPSEELRNGAAARATVAPDKILSNSQKGNGEDVIYSCQATELRNFSSSMSTWDPRQYVRDLRSRNLSTGIARNTRSGRTLEFILASMRLIYVLMVCAARSYIAYPVLKGQQEKTPVESLNLSPGELVQVRSKEEIEATLDKDNCNRGLLFDAEMLPFCGNIYRVLRRVNHIIDEKSGKMISMKYPCIVLENVYCRSEFHRFCPRAIYVYWRENWLTRA